MEKRKRRKEKKNNPRCSLDSSMIPKYQNEAVAGCPKDNDEHKKDTKN